MDEPVIINELGTKAKSKNEKYILITTEERVFSFTILSKSLRHVRNH